MRLTMDEKVLKNDPRGLQNRPKRAKHNVFGQKLADLGGLPFAIFCWRPSGGFEEYTPPIPVTGVSKGMPGGAENQGLAAALKVPPVVCTLPW